MKHDDAGAAALLRSAGYKVTPQRLLILTTVRDSHGHHSAQQICETVRESYPFVDVSTVYRTLATLRKLGVVTETDMGSGDYRYEWSGDQPHHHLICRECGKTEEIGQESLEALSADLMHRHGFTAELRHFAIFGLCAECRHREAIAGAATA